MTLAIKITLIRFPITIVILILLYQKSEVGYSLALVFFILGMLSDILDGYVARKWDQTSEIGGSLDAFLDKVLIYSVLFTLFRFGLYSPAVVFSMFFRDMIVDWSRNKIYDVRPGYGSNLWGKLKFTLQCGSILCGLLYYIEQTYSQLVLLANVLLWAAVFISVPGLWSIVLAVMSLNHPRPSLGIDEHSVNAPISRHSRQRRNTPGGQNPPSSSAASVMMSR